MNEQEDRHARHFTADEVPPERARRGVELFEQHAAWVNRQAGLGVPFDSAGRPEGSDYNQHSYDLDASGDEQDDFAAAAAEVMAA